VSVVFLCKQSLKNTTPSGGVVNIALYYGCVILIRSDTNCRR